MINENPGNFSDHDPRRWDPVSQFKAAIDVNLPAGWTVLHSGRDGDGLQAVLKRPNGTTAGVEGWSGVRALKSEQGHYKTPRPESYIWAPWTHE